MAADKSCIDFLAIVQVLKGHEINDTVSNSQELEFAQKHWCIKPLLHQSVFLGREYGFQEGNEFWVIQYALQRKPHFSNNAIGPGKNVRCSLLRVNC